jgi:hypothetical protein
MSEQNTANQVSLVEVSKALEVVAVLLSQLNIPATRSQEFAITINVLGELKTHVDSKLNPQNVEESVVSEAETAALAQEAPAE